MFDTWLPRLEQSIVKEATCFNVTNQRKCILDQQLGFPFHDAVLLKMKREQTIRGDDFTE
jgi:hypothetical protein